MTKNLVLLAFISKLVSLLPTTKDSLFLYSVYAYTQYINIINMSLKLMGTI